VSTHIPKQVFGLNFSSGYSGTPFVGESFILTIFFPGQKNQRRQGGNFIGGAGGSTSTCDAAVIYSLVNWQLFANTTGNAQQFNCSPTDHYKAFLPSSNPSSTTTIFSVDNQGNLLWTNYDIYNGGALFCITPDGAIHAIFKQNVQPSGCVFINLNLVRCENRSASGSASTDLIVSNCVNAVVITGKYLKTPSTLLRI
jgi:hypothetical protein